MRDRLVNAWQKLRAFHAEGAKPGGVFAEFRTEWNDGHGTYGGAGNSLAIGIAELVVAVRDERRRVKRAAVTS